VSWRVPVARPTIAAEEQAAVAAVMESGWLTQGEVVRRFEQAVADYVGGRHGIATTSGTTAIHAALMALGIGPGDEVVTNPLTCIATTNPVLAQGAKPVFADIDPVTLNISADTIRPVLTSKTRAILHVHLFGRAAGIEEVAALCNAAGLPLIEDCAQAMGARCGGRRVGTFGRVSCFSFYANKIITTGEGGMVTTDDDALAERLRLLRNLAFQRPRFLHEHAGHNFRMTGYQAAMGLVQLDRIDFILEQKRRVAQTYDRLFEDVPGIATPVELDWARNVYWMYGIVVAEEFPLSRDELMAYLAEREIESRTFFCPMNMQPFLRRQDGFRDVPCPVAERLWQRGMYIPCSIDLSDETLAEVVDHIRSAAGVPT
jgi:perosamine synthetase